MRADANTETEVMAVLHKFAETFSQRDMDGLLALFAPDPDVVLFGTGPNERHMGKNEIKVQAESDWAQSEGLSMDIIWSSVSAAGPVAWVAMDCVIHVKTDGREMDFPLRWTVVLEKREDEWLIVQSHGSMPVSGSRDK